MRPLLDCLATPLRRLFSLLRRAQGKSLLRGAHQQSVHGIVIAVGAATEHQDEFFSKCSRALDLIKTHDPSRFHRVQRDLRLVFMSAGGGPYYDPAINGFIIDSASLRAATITRLASLLVHEATHARLHRMGLGRHQAAVERIEAACVRAEIAFLGRVPHTADLVRRLEHSTLIPWYSEEERKRRVQRFVDGYGLPRWLGKFIVLVGRRWD